MNKKEYIEMLKAENTQESKKKLYNNVIKCLENALLALPDLAIIEQNDVGLEELYNIIENFARENKLQCLSDEEASQILAKQFNVKCCAIEKTNNTIVNLEDFI